ncbi:hypothetical protein B0H21DRAFT_819095 [Amylocystis lapponica]|nr:hypothetical protein B0H21DRAFT_819095 [Amylocystis lapponica]
MSDRTHWKMELNNYLQRQHIGNMVPEETEVGTKHAPTWRVKVFIGDVEFGYGEAPTKAAAWEKAAQQALRGLQNTR